MSFLFPMDRLCASSESQPMLGTNNIFQEMTVTSSKY